jgi:hypothetical protein
MDIQKLKNQKMDKYNFLKKETPYILWDLFKQRKRDTVYKNKLKSFLGVLYDIFTINKNVQNIDKIIDNCKINYIKIIDDIVDHKRAIEFVDCFCLVTDKDFEIAKNNVRNYFYKDRKYKNDIKEISDRFRTFIIIFFGAMHFICCTNKTKIVPKKVIKNYFLSIQKMMTEHDDVENRIEIILKDKKFLKINECIQKDVDEIKEIKKREGKKMEEEKRKKMEKNENDQKEFSEIFGFLIKHKEELFKLINPEKPGEGKEREKENI